MTRRIKPPTLRSRPAKRAIPVACLALVLACSNSFARQPPSVEWLYAHRGVNAASAAIAEGTDSGRFAAKASRCERPALPLAVRMLQTSINASAQETLGWIAGESIKNCPGDALSLLPVELVGLACWQRIWGELEGASASSLQSESELRTLQARVTGPVEASTATAEKKTQCVETISKEVNSLVWNLR